MSASQERGLILGLGLATWMEFYTFDAVNLVLPDLAGAFGISRDQSSWILTVFSSALFLGIPISIWMASSVGHLKYIIACTAVFALASLGCACSTHFETILMWRAIQGFSSSGLIMWWRATIYMVFRGPKRSACLKRVSVMLYSGTAAGLLFSGYITDHVSWRLIFLPDVAVAGLAISLLRRHFPLLEGLQEAKRKSPDAFGILLLGIALVTIQIVLSRGEVDDWLGSWTIQTQFWIGILSMLSFIAWQKHEQNRSPLLRLDLLRYRHTLASVFLGLFAGMILTGSLYALPEFLREISQQNLNASTTGRVMSTYPVTAALFRLAVTPLIAKFGQRKAMAFAMCMLIASMWLMARLVTLATPAYFYVLPLMLYAFCLAPMLSSIGGGTVAKLPQDQQLDALSVYMTFRQLGAALGVTLITVLLNRREVLHSGRLFDHLTAGNLQLGRWLMVTAAKVQLHDATAIDAAPIALKMLAESAGRQAATQAYVDAFLFMGMVGLLALCFVPLMSPSPVVKK